MPSSSSRSKQRLAICGRDAVADPAGAEQEADAVAVARRVDRRAEERGAWEEIRARDLEPAEELAPVLRERPPAPRPRSARQTGAGDSSTGAASRISPRLSSVHQTRCSSSCANRRFAASGSRRCLPRAHVEHERAVDAHAGSEARATAAARGSSARLLGREGQPHVLPVARQASLDRVPLINELHRPISIMTPVAQVEGISREAPRLSEDRLRELFREMLVIRRFEEKVEERFRAGRAARFPPCRDRPGGSCVRGLRGARAG